MTVISIFSKLINVCWGGSGFKFGHQPPGNRVGLDYSF